MDRYWEYDILLLIRRCSGGWPKHDRGAGAKMAKAPQLLTFTNNFPVFVPSNSRINAAGAFRNPSTSSSRYFNRPCISHGTIAWAASANLAA